MRKRAEQVDHTRLRITEAAMRLHTTRGPAYTTLSAVADEAGVTRVTLYRHFPDDDTLFAACSGHWIALHPPPDADTWGAVPPLEPRARHALGELYGWYADNAEALFLFRRDAEALPDFVQSSTAAGEAVYADALVAGSNVRGRARRRLRAVAGHVVAYPTWHSLVVGQGLTDEEAVDLAVRFLEAGAADSGPAR